MQSYIQYRRFRTAVQAQVDRDRARARGGAGTQSDFEPLSNSAASDESKSDLEKGQSSLGASSGLQPRSQTVNPAEADPDLGSPLPNEEKETVEHNQRPEDTCEPAEDTEDEDDDFELNQNRHESLSRTTTQNSMGTALGNVLTGINIRRRTTREGGDGNVFVVGYEGENDVNDPHTWSLFTKIRCTVLIALIGIVVGLASAIDSSAVTKAAKDFGVSEVTESLATGIFLVGFGCGALVAGPISETVGRNPVYIGTLGIYMIFIMASALAPNIGAQLAFRFLAGIFGATPLTCAGGSISDMWSPLERVFAFPIFANAAFTGPLLGPVMGGFIAQSHAVSWRWVEWTTLLFSGVVTIIVILFQPETFPPILLKWKAKHLRDLTGDQRYRGEIEIRQETFFHRLKRSLYRPFLLTAREPIIIILALYLTVVYIVIFTFLDGYEFIFGRTYGISQGLTGLCFLGIIIGLFGASALVPLIYKWAKSDLRKIEEQGGSRLPPEFRLWYSMLGGSFAIPISLFWMAWTARPDISIWSPLAASVVFGYGILCVFITCYQYIIDSYESYAASALASITLIRYMASGGMVVVGIPFYKNLGVAYTLTIMACLGVLMAPAPYVLYKYGPWIRTKSKYAINAR